MTLFGVGLDIITKECGCELYLSFNCTANGHNPYELGPMAALCVNHRDIGMTITRIETFQTTLEQQQCHCGRSRMIKRNTPTDPA